VPGDNQRWLADSAGRLELQNKMTQGVFLGLVTDSACSPHKGLPVDPPQYYPKSLCPQIHYSASHGFHDPSGPQYIKATDTWHLLPDVDGGEGHAWSRDLVHWTSDPSYPTDVMGHVPETGSVTVTPSGMYFIYAGLGGFTTHEGAFRAVSTDPRNWSGWITGPNGLSGSVANSSLRCPSYPCPSWNVIPKPASNPHDFRDPSVRLSLVVY